MSTTNHDRAARGGARRLHFSTEAAMCRVQRQHLKLIQPGNVDDQLTEILRKGARALLAQAVEARLRTFSASMPI
jgi:hypothetical protein